MFAGFRRACAVGLAAAVVIAGCGPVTSGVQGISCKVNTDCNSGLSCLTIYAEGDASGDGGCSSVGAECLQPCKTNSDCTEQGYVCLAACEGSPACLPAPAAADAAADAVPDAMTDAAGDVTSQ